MKITDPRIIQTGEKKLIAALQQHLDLETVKSILKDHMAETLFEPKDGQIVVHNNQIAFRLDFDIKLSGSLLFDRQGNYIPGSSESPPLSTDDPFEGDTHRSSVPPESDRDVLDDLMNDTGEEDLDLLLEEEEEEVRGFQPRDNDTPGRTDDDDLDSDEILDDDIDDILKESREFWNQKKGD